MTYLESMNQAFQKHYANRADVWTFDRGLRDSPGLILECLPKNRSYSVLDIGAGKAADGPVFLKNGHHYCALDLVEHAEWSTLKEIWGDRFTAHALAFQSFSGVGASYDVIYDSGCFHHQHPDDLTSYIDKIACLLKQSGVLALNIYTPTDENAEGKVQTFSDGRFAHVWNLDQLLKLLKPFPFRLMKAIRLPHANGKNFYLLAILERTL